MALAEAFERGLAEADELLEGLPAGRVVPCTVEEPESCHPPSVYPDRLRRSPIKAPHLVPGPVALQRLTMLWISRISGSPGLMPTSARTGISRSLNASSC